MSLSEILSKDDPALLSSSKELPFDILSLVINSRAYKCYSLLRDSSEFGKHVRNITHINPGCVTSEMLKDFLESELGENENWVDLAVEMKSSELINKLDEKAAGRIIGEDDAELFALIEDKNIEEVFRRNKYNIAISLKDKRVTKVSSKTLEQERPIRTRKFAVIECGPDWIPCGAFNYTHQSHTYDNGPKYIIIPPSVTVIICTAFGGCSSLKSVTIPSSVTRIGDFAFSECSSLKRISIPSSITSIGDKVFSWCSSLKRITIHGEVIGRIGLRLFVVNSHTLIGIDIHSEDCTINNNLLTEYENTEEFTIPSTVTVIDREVFSGCSSLETITIPSSVTRIGDFAFNECSSLKSVTILSGVTVIEGGAFYWCSSLGSVIIPSSVTKIGSYAFEMCSSLESISIPSSITSIGDKVFSDCPSLKRIIFQGEVLGRIDSKLFVVNDHSLMGIEIPVKDCTINSKPFTEYENIEEFTIPSTVTAIRSETFCGCCSLKSITIPLSVTQIGREAFSGCSSLKSIEIPSSVSRIEDYTFWECSSLESVRIPPSVSRIGCGAFSECSSLKSITIPSSITTIGNDAFSKCSSLESVTIPLSVTTLVVRYSGSVPL